ncbi:uncharacterized protein BDR25DRAFT_325386 [Lindgomyces ingoldianus]|uniref:Uncharacterized protein n=1 Tax=Lindgomyces ingoldianus TaxID=673940 RepID=A0ACB6QX82_9PLEO|nr:uncharacterized protein BDR25DRAFT_325386 [Lindgomyces ingoldianus]KAF2471115.1 hypothetical protein BDR25DRAFT_325386 [Lindgomyces ingoldianus]
MGDRPLGRAGFASRDRRGGRVSSWGKPKAQNLPDISLHPLGNLIDSLDNSSLDLAVCTTSRSSSITDCKYVTSYNWLNEKTPTIMVPGRPPLWTPLDEPRRLNEDRGNYFRDPNAARFPEYPTEPSIQALFTYKPEFPTSSVDLFACGSTMGNLLRFVRSIDKPFRFGVEVVGNTVFFVRKENSPDELIDGVRGFGHTFPETYTTWEKEVKGSDTHQRVIQYHFGGLNCLVRFESDGYLGNLTADNDTLKGEPNTPLDEDGLAKAFEAVSVYHPYAATSNLTLKTGGSEVLQQSIFDLKTRSGKWGKQIDISEQLPALWVKQIPNFIVAYHDGEGRFEKDKIQTHDVRKDIQQWETENKAALKRLAALLRKIIDFAKASHQGMIEVYRYSIDRLEIRTQFDTGTHALPLSLRNRWASNSAPGSKVPDIPSPIANALRKMAEQNDNDGTNSDADFGDGFTHILPGKSLYEDNDDLDFTACSAEDCGYCGRCSY